MKTWSAFWSCSCPDVGGYCIQTRPPQVLVGIVVALLLLAVPPHAGAQVQPMTHAADRSVRAAFAESFDRPRPAHRNATAAQDTNEGRTPRGALWRSLAFPGWGQFYNRDYLKIPIVYAALGGVGYLTYSTNDSYLTHRRAALFRLGEERAEEGEPNEWAQFEDEWLTVRAQFGGTVSSAQVRDRRDTLRRNRDLLVILSGVTYALSVIEAYVAAQLKDFDVGEDLGFSVLPGQHGVSTTLRVTF